MSGEKGFKPLGLPWWIAGGIFAIVMFAAATGALSTDLAGSFALMLSIGMVCNEIGERIPFWNSYIGGGLVLTFLVSACLFSYGLVPAKYAEGITLLMDDVDFLSFFIIFLIVGSILSLERKLMLRSFAGYIPAIIGGLIGASILGVVVGIPFGIAPSNVIIKYMLPIMGGGNGAGAVPLSQIYETITGEPAASYYSFAITILTIANIFAILTAAVLHKIGEVKTTWTGDGTQLIRGGENFATEDKKVSASMRDLGGAFFLAVGFYAMGRLFAKTILPEIFGTPIHQFAYMIIFVAVAAGLGIIPDNIRAAAKKLQSFFSNNIILIIMVGVGADTNIIELLEAITLGNVVIAFAVVVGAIVGSALVGYLVGFYPIDSAITAGLCMANRGGSGDLAVLGASKRMSLMAYAQLSSRLGGGMVLILGSILFGTFLK
ncbi:MAG: 2-hydroxycarboxylate transporter family protein [Lachnospiraceae bacterium]